MARTTRLLPAALATGLLAATAPAEAAQYFDVAKLPAPTPTGKQLSDAVEAFSTEFSGRVTGTPIELAAADHLIEELTAMGYAAEMLELPMAGAPGGVTHAVIATRPGRTKPDEHIVFGGHYDELPQSGDAAYDNGSGTMMVLGLARAFKDVPTNRTLTFAFYNGEEEGALASDEHAKLFKAQSKKVRAYLGFDMVGIGWPVANPGTTNCLCMWRGDVDEAFDPLLKHVNFDVLGFPNATNRVEVRGSNTRNSDEASWNIAGYPTLRWAGLRTAGDYPQYHKPLDNMETIDETAGGRIYFEQGMRNTLMSAYYTALTLDNEQPVANATAGGSGAITFDASASTDADGAVSEVTWDFGDGTTATGTTVTHEYAQPGTYTAIASVGDSLWPAVRSTATVQVRVEPKPAAAPAPVVAPAPPPAVQPRAKKAVKKKAAAKKRCKTKRVKSKRGKTRTVRTCAKSKAKTKKAKAKARKRRR